MNSSLKSPSYEKFAYISLGFVAGIIILYMAGSILIPLICATLLAIVLDPLVTILTRHKLKRTGAIILTLLFTILVITFISIFVISQASSFTDSFPKLIDKLQELINSFISKTSDYLNISPKDVGKWITKTKDDLLAHSSILIGQTIGTLGSILAIVVLIPVYIFMILYYKPLLLEFIHKLFEKSHPDAVNEIFTEIKIMIQKYLVGLIKQAAIIASLYTISFLILGIDYAILLGLIGALLNVVPFVGAWVAVTLFMIITLVTKSTFTYVVLVLMFFLVIHFIDNTYIIPKIVASKVKINALTSIVAVIVGHALWGIPGMFLSIPLVALVKLLFDHIEPLKPWGYLLGDTMPIVEKKNERKNHE